MVFELPISTVPVTPTTVEVPISKTSISPVPEVLFTLRFPIPVQVFTIAPWNVTAQLPEEIVRVFAPLIVVPLVSKVTVPLLVLVSIDIF